MSTKADRVRHAKAKNRFFLAKEEGRTIKHAIRFTNRCSKCGRGRGYLRDFDMCRICVRELAEKGLVPGLKRSSW